MQIESVLIKDLIIATSILAVAFIVSKLLRIALNRYIKRAALVLKTDPTSYNFFKNTVTAIVFSLAIFLIFYLIPELKALGLTLFAGAGIVAAIIGFASQQAFSNIITGVFIVIFKPFRVGDLIKVGTDQLGIVEDITLRHTIIRSFENRRLVIPNSVIGSQTILNSTINEIKTCIWVEMSISYDSSVDHAVEIMQEESMKHPDSFDNRSEEAQIAGDPEVIVRLISFGDSSVNLRAYVWCEDPLKGFAMKCDLHKLIKERFDNEGVEIPFPYRTIVYKKDQNAG